jgi:bromodomain-containing protein 7
VLLRFVGELEKLDPNGIFADPVTDAIAPGYSTLIRNPMDLSTIKTKLDNLEYPTTVSLRSDMILMLDNCTKYNTADTPFHQLALKLEKDVKRIVTIKRAAKFLKKSGVDPDGIDELLADSRILENEGQNEQSVDSDNENAHDGVPEKRSYSPRSLKKVEWAPLKPGTMELTEPVLDHPDQCSHTDTMDVVDVLKSVTRAAAEARERLCLKYPGEARLGYIQHAFAGKMEFTTISDGFGERGVRMPIIPVELETPEPEIDPVDYLTYGPYGQYKPTYDNRLKDFLNLSQEKDKDFEKKNELGRLKKIYGGERELGYVQSIQCFVEDMEQPAVEAAEEVLINVTRGRNLLFLNYEKTIQGLHETTRLNKMPAHDIKMDFEALESLKSLGIDTSWLEAFNSNSAVFKKAELIDKTLKEAAELMTSINEEILRGDMSGMCCIFV